MDSLSESSKNFLLLIAGLPGGEREMDNVGPINGRAGAEPRPTERNHTAGPVRCIGGLSRSPRGRSQRFFSLSSTWSPGSKANDSCGTFCSSLNELNKVVF